MDASYGFRCGGPAPFTSYCLLNSVLREGPGADSVYLPGSSNTRLLIVAADSSRRFSHKERWFSRLDSGAPIAEYLGHSKRATKGVQETRLSLTPRAELDSCARCDAQQRSELVTLQLRTPSTECVRCATAQTVTSKLRTPDSGAYQQYACRHCAGMHRATRPQRPLEGLQGFVGATELAGASVC